MSAPAAAGREVEPVAPSRERAAASHARRMVEDVAPALGLRPADVRLHLGGAGRRALAFGASGLVADGQAYLAADPLTRAASGCSCTNSSTSPSRPRPPPGRHNKPTPRRRRARSPTRSSPGWCRTGRPPGSQPPPYAPTPVPGR